MNAEKEEAALEGIYADSFSVPRDAAQDALDQLEAYNSNKAREMKEEIASTYQSSSLLFLIIVLFTLVFGLGIALILTRSITGPLSETVTMIQEMEKGHLGMRLTMTRHDEIGDMARIMDIFADNLQNQVVRIMKAIAGGEEVTEIPVMDDQDEIGPALKETADAINRLIGETEKLVSAAAAGELSYRGDETGFQGGYRKIIAGFNTTLENLLLPLQEGMDLADRYAEGDYSARFSENVPVNGDFVRFRDTMNTVGIESGQAVRIVKNEVESLLSKMESTSSSTQEISAGTRILAANANEVSDLTERSRIGIQQILQAMNDLASAVSAVASETSGVATLTQETSDLSSTGTELVEKTGQGMKNIKASFEETNLVVGEIHSQMDEIGSIVEVIGGIADQTNLLALNAAIEAARAGEAGLGFAVVADEVKTLAEESRHSAEKIATLITELQRKSENVTMSMKRSIDDVNSGDEAVRNTMEIFDKIADSIGDLSHRVSGVAATTEEQAASVEEISASVHEVDTQVEATAKSAISASAATEEASAALDQVAGMITDAAAATDRISQAMDRFVV